MDKYNISTNKCTVKYYFDVVNARENGPMNAAISLLHPAHKGKQTRKETPLFFISYMTLNSITHARDVFFSPIILKTCFHLGTISYIT